MSVCEYICRHTVCLLNLFSEVYFDKQMSRMHCRISTIRHFLTSPVPKQQKKEKGKMKFTSLEYCSEGYTVGLCREYHTKPRKYNRG